MELFVNTCDLEAVQRFSASNAISGVTTNPSLVARTQRAPLRVAADLAGCTTLPISVQVVAETADGMVRQGRALAAVADSIVVKVPLTWEGLAACRALAAEGIKVNLTLCFTVAQALLARHSGATYLSVFSGRLAKLGLDGSGTLTQITRLYVGGPKVVAASIGEVEHVLQAAEAGADIATVSPQLLSKLGECGFTESGLADFLSDWRQSAGAAAASPEWRSDDA